MASSSSIGSIYKLSLLYIVDILVISTNLDLYTENVSLRFLTLSRQQYQLVSRSVLNALRLLSMLDPFS